MQFLLGFEPIFDCLADEGVSRCSLDVLDAEGSSSGGGILAIPLPNLTIVYEVFLADC